MSNLRLLNKYEEITFDKLKCAKEFGAHVFAKVRLADVFPISGSGISNDEYSYCLKAHFDFLVTDKKYIPLFSVEYDGKQHKYDKRQIENDKIKNLLCEQFTHPILRINSNYINREYKGIDLLTYFIDSWFLEEAFYDAQTKGLVSPEECFDICSIIVDGKGRKWPYWLSSDIQVKIQKLYRSGKIGQMAPSHWIGIDKEENYKCICWVEVDSNNVISVKTGMRKQLFTAVQISDLLCMLAIFDLDKKLENFLSRNELAIAKYDFEENLTQFCNDLTPMESATCGSISYPIF